jgi:metallo-beta-lactamase family protein
VLLTGYQAVGTRGRALQDGATSLRMHGQEVTVNAQVMTVEGLSSHADRNEILRWVGSEPRPPARIFVVHGEPNAAAHLADRLRAATGAQVMVPELNDAFDLVT